MTRVRASTHHTRDRPRVVYAEADEAAARETSAYLGAQGLTVAWFVDARAAVAECRRELPDVAVVELQPGGLDLPRLGEELRGGSELPLIVLSARRAESDVVRALEGGADAFVAKPVSQRELLAHIRAQLRRSRPAVEGPAVVRVGRLALDRHRWAATLDGAPLALTAYEFALLALLAGRAGRVLTREQLLLELRDGADDPLDRSIDVHVSRLRRKLGDDSRQPKLIRTVRGVGYVLELGQ